MKKIVAIIVSFCLLLSFSGCSNMNKTQLFYQGEFMYIDYSLKNASNKEAETIENQVKEIIDQVEKLVALSDPESNISKINNSKGDWVEVDPMVVEMLKISTDIYNKTDGAFNPAMYPIVKLWGFAPDNQGNYTESREVPSSQAIADLLLHTDFAKIEIKGNKVRFLDPEMQIDLGGIAKGYAVDLVQEIFLKSQAEPFEGLISLMSNQLAIGSKAKNTPYTIAVTNPRPEETNNSYFAVISLADMGLSTSGDYEKYFITDEKRYCHIIGKNGYPIDDVIAVTVFENSSAVADAMSTALCVMDMETAVNYATENKIDCIIIDKNLAYATIGDVTIKEGMEINKAYTKYE